MKYKTEWDLTHLYRSPKDQKMEQDVAAIEKAYTAFEKKYAKTKSFVTSADVLSKALHDYEKMIALPNPLVYLFLYNDIYSGDADAEALRTKFSQRITAAENRVLFFRLSLAAIPVSQQKIFLKDPKLADFRYFLEIIFKEGKYNLSESEEKILNLKSLPAKEMWIQSQEKLLAKQSVIYRKKEIPLSQAQSLIRDLPINDRHQLHSLVFEKLKSISDFAEAEINAVVVSKKIDDELRGYKKPYESTIIGYQNEVGSIESLVDIVTKSFGISHRFYKIKAKMLGLKKLAYADRAVPVGINKKKVPLEQGLAIVENGFNDVDPKYGAYLRSYLENGQIDIYPKKGKVSGAFCMTYINCPTYVLLNYVESLNDVSTLAHEMGHAIHGELSKSQRGIYQGHTISVAEVASTLFENFAFEKLLATLSDEEKIVALHDRIQDDVQTIFRQIACFNFENELHMSIREKGQMSKEEIATLMNTHMKAYLGPVFNLEELDGYFFVTWSHIRRSFYVYSYAYGQIISKALYARYLDDKKYIQKIEKFLSAGESMSPEAIWKSIGIDTSKSEFFEAGLKSIENDIARLEKLVARQASTSKKR